MSCVYVHQCVIWLCYSKMYSVHVHVKNSGMYIIITFINGFNSHFRMYISNGDQNDIVFFPDMPACLVVSTAVVTN